MSPKNFSIYFIIFLLAIMFFPYYTDEFTLVNCQNVPDTTGGYNQDCDKKHKLTNFYKEHIAK